MYYNPVEVIETNNWLTELQNQKEKLNITSPIIITSTGNKKRLNLISLFDPELIFDDFCNNPNFENCTNAIQFCRKKYFDGVLAIGGGSTMDLAKIVIAHLCTDITIIHDLISYKENYPKTIPSIFIPTTHGTASEVTMWGTIWNMKEKKKYSISHPYLYPNVAILDGNLTISLPLDISITTVMDALSHSFEAIWNKNANNISTSYAIEAISLIIENVKDFKKSPENLIIRNNFLIAANKAGLAFSNTKTAAAHSISYPLTIHYGIPHGIASSICLIPILKLNKQSIQDSLIQICENNKLTYYQLLETIKMIPQGVISYSLSDWGIAENQLPMLVEKSFTSDRMDNNIVSITESEVFQILKSVL